MFSKRPFRGASLPFICYFSWPALTICSMFQEERVVEIDRTNRINAMSITYSIDSKRNLISIDVSGTNSDQDWIDLFHELKNNPERKDSMNLLVDTRDQKSVISTNVLTGIVQQIKSKDKLVKYAILCSRAVSVGVANMANALMKNKRVEVRAFAERDEALTWLEANLY